MAALYPARLKPCPSYGALQPSLGKWCRSSSDQSVSLDSSGTEPAPEQVSASPAGDSQPPDVLRSAVARIGLRNYKIHWIVTHWSGMDTTIRHNNSNKCALVYGLSRA